MESYYTGWCSEGCKKVKNFNIIDVYLVSNYLTKQIIDNIAKLLSYCFNLCLLEGIFPDELRLSRICPILKKEKLEKDTPESYRPISVIPIILKLFEILVCDQLN